ncbi:metallophosphoesterase family protein [Deinococcus irradiatisoli]|uniref:metallophosphoesterase family protein n=1 Tax=Deinococcus irradiatisoli TaxID=2202254 RepID=UPI0015E83689|nr:hypothetical protein [Deinococcus irradiatisoli]
MGGHTHRPLLRTLEGWQLLNPGSVGMPFEQRNGAYLNVARAGYLLMDEVPDGWSIQFRRRAYPARQIREGLR